MPRTSNLLAFYGKAIGTREREAGHIGTQPLRATSPSWLIDSLLAIGAYQRAGGPTETITSVVAELTGKPPRSFAAFATTMPPRFGSRPAWTSGPRSTGGSQTLIRLR